MSFRYKADRNEGDGLGLMALAVLLDVDGAHGFLPYAVMRDGKTLFETVSQNPQFLLGPQPKP